MYYRIRRLKNTYLIAYFIVVIAANPEGIKTFAQQKSINIPAEELKLADSLIKNIRTKRWEDTLAQFNQFAQLNLEKNDGAIAIAGQKLGILPTRPCLNLDQSKAWLLISKALVNIGKPAEAEKYVDKAIHCPVNVPTTFLLDAISHKAFIELTLNKIAYALQLAELIIQSKEATSTIQARGYLAKSMCLYDMQNYAESKKAIEEAIEFLQKDTSNVVTYVSIYTQAGLIHYRIGNFPQSLKNYLNAKRLAEKARAYDLLFTIYNNLGTVFWQAGDLPAASSFFEKALDFYGKMKYPDLVDVHMIYNNLGLVYQDLNNETEAENYLARSVEGYQQSGDSSGMAYPLNNLANLYLKQKRFDEGLKCIDIAIKILTKEKRNTELIPVLHTKAQLLVEKKLLPEADNHLDKAILLAQELELPQELVYLYEEKARIAELQGNFKMALDFYKTFHQYQEKYNASILEVKLEQARAEVIENQKKVPEVSTAPQKLKSYGVSRAWAIMAMMAGLLLISLIFWFNQFLLTQKARSENRRIEEEIIQLRKSLAEQMEKAAEIDHLKNHIFATMYHELRTPLNGINGFAELLFEECTNEKHRRMALTILQSGERLLNTLNGILELSDTELLKLDVKLSNFKVHEIIEKKIREKYRDMAEEKGLAFYYQPRTTQTVVRSDEEIFTRILDLLIDNAVKFTTKGSITLELIEENNERGNFAHIKIIDTGIGIPYERQGLIFSSFRQASEGHRRNYDGSGVGLSLAKNLTNILGGNISVESTPGEGSTFTLTFPALTKEEQQIDSNFKEYALPGVKTHRILIVEDDDTNREFMVYNLQNLYHTDIALDGITALEKIKSRPYDAILLDISLGRGLSGIDVIKELRKNPATRLLPVAAVTANLRLYKPEKMIEVGFTHYLAKPFSRSEILSLVKTMIGQPPES